MENKQPDREIRTAALLEAPVAQVWKAWTEPEQATLWWGPDGFTNTIHCMDLTEGGEWRLTMHGPDGPDYLNRSIFREIVPQEKIVFEHFSPHFMATICFETQGGHTAIEWTLLFDTADMRETVTRVHKADEGQKQNIIKLKKYLSEHF